MKKSTYNLNSIIEKEFFRQLNNPKIKIISIDIFDTLVFRKVAEPTDIYSKVGKKSFVKRIFQTPDSFRRHRVNAEVAARKRHKHLDEITIEQIYNEFFFTKKIQNKIMNYERKTEKKNIFINEYFLKLIEYAQYKNKTIVLTSDTYFNIKDIYSFVLSKLPHHISFDKIYLSSVIGKSKAKGSIYPYIIKDLNVLADNILHIGDNSRSDIYNAKSKGINTIHYDLNTNYLNSLMIEDAYLIQSFKSNQALRKLAALQNPFNNHIKNFYFNLGATIFGPILWEFSYWIDDLVKKTKVEQVNFIMREGGIFKKYFERLSKTQCNLIYASSQSTLLPSFDINSFHKSKLNYYTYKQFRMIDFYNTFLIKPINSILDDFKDIPINNLNMIHAEGESLLNIFLEDISNNFSEIQKSITKQKSLLKKYLNQLDIISNSILIDFGGAGRVLEQLSEATNTNFYQEILFYMHEDGYQRSLGKNRFAFLPLTKKTKQAIKLIRRSPEIFEILLNGYEQSTINYMQKNKKILSIKDSTHNNVYLKKIESALHAGIDSFFDVKQVYKNNNRITPEQLALMMARVIDVPTANEVKYLGKLIHEEGKGSSYAYELISKESIQIVSSEKVQNFYFNYTNNINYKKDVVSWPQGTITSIQADFISNLLRLTPLSENDTAIQYMLDIIDQSNINQLHIYGAGDFFLKIKPHLDIRNIKIISLIDSRAEYEAYKVDGYYVSTLDDNTISSPILITSVAFAVEITEKLVHYAKIKKVKIQILNHFNGYITVNPEHLV